MCVCMSFLSCEQDHSCIPSILTCYTFQSQVSASQSRLCRDHNHSQVFTSPHLTSPHPTSLIPPPLIPPPLIPPPLIPPPSSHLPHPTSLIPPPLIPPSSSHSLIPPPLIPHPTSPHPTSLIPPSSSHLPHPTPSSHLPSSHPSPPNFLIPTSEALCMVETPLHLLAKLTCSQSPPDLQLRGYLRGHEGIFTLRVAGGGWP